MKIPLVGPIFWPQKEPFQNMSLQCGFWPARFPARFRRLCWNENKKKNTLKKKSVIWWYLFFSSLQVNVIYKYGCDFSAHFANLGVKKDLINCIIVFIFSSLFSISKMTVLLAFLSLKLLNAHAQNSRRNWIARKNTRFSIIILALKILAFF